MGLKFPSLYSCLIHLATSHSNPIFKGFLFFFKFLMWTIFKVFVEFVTITLLFYDFGFFSFGHKSCGLLAPPNQGLNQHPLHWQCGVLTTGPPGKSLGVRYLTQRLTHNKCSINDAYLSRNRQSVVPEGCTQYCRNIKTAHLAQLQ